MLSFLKKWIFRLSISINLLLCLLLFSPLVNWMFDALAVEENIQKADAIVLLSSGFYSQTHFDRKTYHRINKALSLYKQGYSSKIIICGGGKPSNSSIMKRYLVEHLSIPEEDIIAEEKSRDTHENIKYAKEILESLNAKHFLLVTSSSHMYRSVKICKKQGLEPFPAPVEPFETELRSFHSRSRFIADIFREYGAIIYFKWQGWI